MTTEREVERIVERWLVDGVDKMPDRVYLSILDRVERQPQQHAWRVSWRESNVNAYLKPILAVAAVLLVAVVGLNVLPIAPSSIGGPAPTATPSPTPTPTPSPPALSDGPLEAGDYAARITDAAGDQMTFVITAPAGWSGVGGWALYGPPGFGPPGGISIELLHDPRVVTDPCSPSVGVPSPAPSPASVDDLVGALSAHAGVQVAGVTDIELGGHSGKRLDLELPAEPSCAQYYVFDEPQGVYAQGPANHWRIWILDVDGHTAVAQLSDFAGTSATDLAAAQAAIDSLRISR
jgi:hypothetical protein